MQISSHIHAVKIPFIVPTPLGNIERFVYVYLICDEQVTLIDSGVAGAEQVIFSYLEAIGRSREINYLLLTHSHPDHIGAARAIQSATGCAVLAGATERSWIEDTDRQAAERPVPGFNALVGGPVEVHRIIAAGELLELGDGLTLEVIDTPGHSAGSQSFLLHEENALFSGDAVPVPGDMPIYDDYHTSLATLERLQRLNGVELLLEAWQEPRTASFAERLAAGRSWLQTVDAAVRQQSGAELDPDAMSLCRRVVAQLGLSPLAANPLVARSLRSHGFCHGQINS
jgi:glyoxylase-like metal-dependent hydrolase (beta-lactamase superfamily II)